MLCFLRFRFTFCEILTCFLHLYLFFSPIIPNLAINCSNIDQLALATQINVYPWFFGSKELASFFASSKFVYSYVGMIFDSKKQENRLKIVLEDAIQLCLNFQITTLYNLTLGNHFGFPLNSARVINDLQKLRCSVWIWFAFRPSAKNAPSTASDPKFCSNDTQLS